MSGTVRCPGCELCGGRGAVPWTPTPAAPVVQGADELREAPSDAELYRWGRLAYRLADAGLNDEQISAVFALLEPARLLAEREQAKVARVRDVLAEIDRQAEVHDMHGLVTAHRPIAARLRRALDGDSA